MDFGLKNINMMSKDTYDKIAEPAHDELYVVSSSGFGFPSNNYDDLELGASETEYTAPANGYFFLNKNSSAASQYITMKNVTTGLLNTNVTAASGSGTREFMFAKKGEKVQVVYTTGGTTNAFRFIYAEGE